MEGLQREQIERAFIFLEKRQDEMFSLLRRLVNQESGNGDKAGCDAMCALMKEELEGLGAVTRVTPMEAKGNFLYGVWGEGRGLDPVLFSGHMDTVFPKGTLAKNPFRVENGRIMGPGALDMKAGLVIALFAARALKEAGYEARPLRFAFPGDEENGHRESGAAEEIKKAARGCAAAFNFETGYPDDGIVVERKGSCRFTVKVYGVAAHSGNAPEKGRNAILEMAHKVIALQALNDLEHGTSLNVGLVAGGTSVNSVPDFCQTSVDVRYTKKERLDTLLGRVRQICAETQIEGTRTELILSSVSAVMEPSLEILGLFEHVKKAAEETGYPGKLHPIKVGGWSDASLIAAEHVPVVCGMGAKGEFNHTDREYADVSSLVPRAKLAAASVILLQ
ncbi:MAG: M20 family metallopeptidase [Lachnospiraceae bacterium]|nr:M20 family metallopeptidase [Lachnospiraceae bacterium]